VFPVRSEAVYPFKAHRLCVSLNSRLESNKEEEAVCLFARHTPECLAVGISPEVGQPAPSSRYRCRANSAHIRQSRPESGLGLQVKVRNTFKVVRKRLCTAPRSRRNRVAFEHQLATGRSVFIGYRGTSLIRNRRRLGPYSRTMPRALWGS